MKNIIRFVLALGAFIITIVSLLVFLLLDGIHIALTRRRSKAIKNVVVVWVDWLSWPFEPSEVWV